MAEIGPWQTWKRLPVSVRSRRITDMRRAFGAGDEVDGLRDRVRVADDLLQPLQQGIHGHSASSGLAPTQTSLHTLHCARHQGAKSSYAPPRQRCLAAPGVPCGRSTRAHQFWVIGPSVQPSPDSAVTLTLRMTPRSKLGSKWRIVC